MITEDFTADEIWIKQPNLTIFITKVKKTLHNTQVFQEQHITQEQQEQQELQEQLLVVQQHFLLVFVDISYWLFVDNWLFKTFQLSRSRRFLLVFQEVFYWLVHKSNKISYWQQELNNIGLFKTFHWSVR